MQTVIGLMSGTSLDGIDAALIHTDGDKAVTVGPGLTLPYAPQFREALRACFGKTTAPDDVVRELTHLHAEAVSALCKAAPAWSPTLIGFHGQTLLHAPQDGVTVQIGDGALLARLTGLPVVDSFRADDIAAGGEGAPMVPLYHAALAAPLPKPLLVLNLGGVANITYLGPDGEIIACDTGPGNALLDDWMLRHTGRACDEGGTMAARGLVHGVLEPLLTQPFFTRPLPKSLDRDAFKDALDLKLSVADGAATLTDFTALCVRAALPLLPTPVERVLVAGGGRHNPAMMRALAARLQLPVDPVETVGWQGDFLEAQAFAYLAKRHLLKLPLSLPQTTGVKAPTGGGRYHSVN